MQLLPVQAGRAACPTLPVLNSSFETSFGSTTNVVPSWTVNLFGSGSAGVFNPGANAAVRNGRNVVYLSPKAGTSEIFQELTSTLLAPGPYELTAFIGRRTTLAFPASCTIELLAGGVVKASASCGPPAFDPGPFDSRKFTVDFTAAANDVDLGEPLQVAIRAGDPSPTATSQAIVDDVWLTNSPDGVTLYHEIYVPNRNFELATPLLGNGSTTANGVVDDWVTSRSGTSSLGIHNPTTTTFPTEAPEGQNVLYLRPQAGLSEVRSPPLVTPLMQGDYCLSVNVGQENAATDGFPDTCTIELRAGASLLTSVDCASSVPAKGTFSLFTLTYTATALSPGLGQPIELRVRATQAASALETAWPDDVRFLPEPSARTALLLGVVLLIGIARLAPRVS